MGKIYEEKVRYLKNELLPNVREVFNAGAALRERVGKGADITQIRATVVQARRYAQTTKSILIYFCGLASSQVVSFEKASSEYIMNKPDHDIILQLPSVCVAFLESLCDQIDNDLLKTITNEISGEVFSDFIFLADRSLEESKDVAAVLCCAAFEDAIKKVATKEDMEVEGKELADIINALKAKGYFSGAQKGIVDSVRDLRNKAMHAKWDKFQKEEVVTMISFTKEFLLKNFS